MNARLLPLLLGLSLYACGTVPTAPNDPGTGTAGGTGSGGTGGGTTPGAPYSIRITGTPNTFRFGDTVALVADVRDANSVKLPTASVTWTTSAPAFVSISATGVIRAVTEGFSNITAKSGAAAWTIPMWVTTGDPASLTLAGVDSSLVVGDVKIMSASVLDSRGRRVTAGVIGWLSDAPAVATVTGGTVHAVALGTVSITATLGKLTASRVFVSRARAVDLTPVGIQVALGDSLKLTALAISAQGNSVPFATPVIWKSTHPEYVTVNASGWAFAIHGPFGGEAAASSITADIGGVVGQTYLTVARSLAGLPAGVRYVHAVQDLGPISFLPNKGAPVPLAFGESRETSPGSGNLSVSVDGFGPPPADAPEYFVMGRTFATLLSPQSHTTVYATGDTQWGEYVVALVDGHGYIAPDSAFVRLLYASNYSATYYGMNLSVVPADTPVDGTTAAWEVDGAGASVDYLTVRAGAVDIVLTDPAHSSVEVKRWHITTVAGQAATYVVTGLTPATMQLLTVIDP